MGNRTENRGNKPGRRRYPPARTSPWFFVVLSVSTVVFILAGIFEYEPLTRVVQWLAVVL